MRSHAHVHVMVVAPLFEDGNVIMLLYAAPVDAGHGDDEQDGEEDHPDDQCAEVVYHVQLLLQVECRRHLHLNS